MYNRYQGNTGKVSRVNDDFARPQPARYNARQEVGPHMQGSTSGVRYDPRQEAGPHMQGSPAGMRQKRPVEAPAPVSIRPPGPLSGLSGELGRLLGKLSPLKLETDDLLLILVLYLMYRESHDEELLMIMGAMFLL